MGSGKVYGPETEKAIENFAVRTSPVPSDLVRAILEIKQAAAAVNMECGFLDEDKAGAVIRVCRDLLENFPEEAFPLPSIQGGAGTSTHTNVNEVIAVAATKLLNNETSVHPNDDVNRFQSTNDVYPTALRIALLRGLSTLAENLADLQTAFQKREQEFASILKIGRTQLQEAVPITLGQEFAAYAEAFARDRWRVFKSMERLRQTNIGGTAIGTGINAPKIFIFKLLEKLRSDTGLALARAEDCVEATQNTDLFAEVSGILKAVAVNFMKISSDIRLLAAGPATGFGELALAPVQAGSTIMPGKVNPVIPELAGSVAIQVMANDQAVTLACASGQLELNAFLPLIARNLLESVHLLDDCAVIFRKKCVETLKAVPEICRGNLEKSGGMVTLLSPYIGYEEAAEVYRHAVEQGLTVRDAAVALGHFTDEELDVVFEPRKATAPGIAGSSLLRDRLEKKLLTKKRTDDARDTEK